MKTYSPYQFSFFRITLGTYLLIHFSMLIPFGEEVFGLQGMLATSTATTPFPNVLRLISPTILLSLLTVLSVVLVIGFQRRILSLFLWYGWACLFNQNILIANPSIPYVGWLLLVLAIVPQGEPLALSKQKERWSIPPMIFWGAWVLMAVGYTLSGVHKLGSPSWVDGTAIYHLVNNPLARDGWLREVLLSFPLLFFKLTTWATLALEIAFLPLCFFSLTRKWAWISMIGLHLGILLMVDFADLTFGMLLIHLFTFDERWFPPKISTPKPVVFFDGVCGLCNHFIDFLFKEDKEGVFQCATLQGETAKKQLASIPEATELKSVVLVDSQGIHTKSSAVLRVLTRMRGFWVICYPLFLLPSALRDFAYNVIATNRYKWFGKKETCRLPTTEERSRFLD